MNVHQCKTPTTPTQTLTQNKTCGEKEKETNVGGMDELLAPLASSLSSDIVHYDSIDLYSWVQTMLTELNPDSQINDPLTSLDSSSSSIPNNTFNDDYEYDLSVIPGMAAYPPQEENTATKRMQTWSESESRDISLLAVPTMSPPAVENTRSVVLVDTQETGVHLVHNLMACADAIQQENLKLVEALVKHISLLASLQTSAMRKVASYFANQ